MGKPGRLHRLSPAPEYIGCVEGTWGSETSQYPQEEKTTCDSVSSGERKRKRLNLVCVIPGRGCRSGVVGVCVPVLPRWCGVRNRGYRRRVWKGPAESVTPR